MHALQTAPAHPALGIRPLRFWSGLQANDYAVETSDGTVVGYLYPALEPSDQTIAWYAVSASTGPRSEFHATKRQAVDWLAAQ